MRECCEKKIPEGGKCIVYSSVDDRLKDLSLREAKFTENEKVCEEQNAEQVNFMAE